MTSCFVHRARRTDLFDPTYGAPEQFKRVKSRSRGVAGMFAGFGVNRDVDVSGIGIWRRRGRRPRLRLTRSAWG